MRRTGSRTVVLVALLGLLAAACANGNKTTSSGSALSLAIGSVPSSVTGNVVSLPITVKGITIVKADGDTSGKTGHFHVFVDRAVLDVGQVIPKERGIVHSADNPVKIWGLEPGQHEFTVVVGDGTHKRIDRQLEDSVKVDVKGPSVWGSAPATVAKGTDVTVQLKSAGVHLAMDSMNSSMASSSPAMSSGSGHFHVLVDPATPPMAGDHLPDPKAGSVYHTTGSSVTISGLKAGEHIIWIVLGTTDHIAWSPAVMDKLTVTVQ